MQKQVEKYDAAIIGAGVTGLAAGYFLQQAGRHITILEREGRPGGVIKTEREAGFLFDSGPNSTLAKSAVFKSLIEKLGIEPSLCLANPAAANRYVLRGGKLRKIPTSPPAFLTSNLLSWHGKLRVLGELFVPRKTAGGRESVADFVRRRLGPEFLDYFINPFVSGVYAGDPETLDVQTAFKLVYELEQQHGGLLRGAIARQQAGKQSRDPARLGLLSFRHGMQELTDALATELAQELELRAAVERVSPAPEGYLLYWRDLASQATRQIFARHLIVATPAYGTADLLAPFSRELADVLLRVPYARVAVVLHGYKAADLPHALDGFGFLVPEKENRNILGSIWSSTLFPNRAPEGAVALTTFVGGARQPELAGLDEASLHTLVHAELREILGVRGAPVHRRIKRWTRAIPQYSLQHQAVLDAIARTEQQFPGLHIAGNFRDGISVADRIDQACAFMKKICEDDNGNEPAPERRHSETRAPAATAAPQ